MTNEPSPRWFTSSYSNNGGQCIQVATNLAHTATGDGVVPVRDSKNPAGPILHLTPRAFLGLVNFARRVGA